MFQGMNHTKTRVLLKRLWPQAATPRAFELGAFPRREPLELGFTDEEQRLQAGIKQHNNGLPVCRTSTQWIV